MADLNNANKVWVIIPAAGVGQRMQADVPKQYLKLHGRTVIEHTLDCFIQHPAIAGIVIALHPNDPYWSELNINSSIPINVVEGGEERADSVLNALTFLTNQLKNESVDKAVLDKQVVMVHDAARPCLSRNDLDALLLNREYGAGSILATPVSDTMKRANDQQQTIDSTVDRNKLWHALTPQMFPIDTLYQALSTALSKGLTITDDASAVELMGLHPALIEGETSNIKITRPADLELAEFFLLQKR